MTDHKHCPDCGGAMAFFELPDLHMDHFERAARLAKAMWVYASMEENPVSVACLAGVLLLKRAAVSLGVPRASLAPFTAFYLDAAHKMILERRAAAAADQQAN